jgi:ubiquitin-like protein Pup
MAQERIQKQHGKARTEETHAEASSKDVTNAELAEATDKVVSDIDEVLEDQLDEELLAEIDDILEENAEEFVDSFIQQGGE